MYVIQSVETGMFLTNSGGFDIRLEIALQFSTVSDLVQHIWNKRFVAEKVKIFRVEHKLGEKV